ncbi:MAG TPA: NAD(P)/FAD-dependent oxidoreductase [Candidatus Limnocylindrales bacterium]|nr:NAD(P)/FAD-dependent oxidoreductase [Candidatus Limnocylindrales bacterium]
MSNSLPHVVIIGGGFGGLYAARELRRAPVRVTVIDRHNHHLFQPLLYEVATAALSPGEIAEPIRHILRRQHNTCVRLAEVIGIDVAARRVKLSNHEEIPYDYLIVATGATHSYFGHNEWAEIAPGLKTLEDAIEIRRRFLLAFEKAEWESDPKRRRALLTFVIIGGGPTGVELAGTMSEVARRMLVKDFKHLDADSIRVILLEGLPRVLPAYPENLSESAKKQLEKLGVEVRVNTRVTGIEPGAVLIGQERIETENIFWAAGVAASPLGATLGVPLDRNGRVEVKVDLSIENHPEVFVIGDLAAVTDAEGKKVPGVAPAAIQMGRHAAKNIQADLKGLPRKPFIYKDRGKLATIGRAAAVADLGRFQFSGLFAWLAWLIVHIYFLIGFDNRLLVLFQWAWAYLGFNRSTRLITYYETQYEPSPKPQKII